LEAFLTSILTHSRGVAAYALIYGILLACGLGVPLPEDISLVLGGFLSHLGVTSLPVMMLVGFLGILSGDSLIYAAGRRIGDRASSGSGFFARVITPEKRAKVEALFARHGQKIVMIARFLPGVRAVTYFTAGSARMSYGRFIFWDGLAAVVSAPLFVYLGCRFGGHLRYVIHRIRQGQKMVIIALLSAFASCQGGPPRQSAPRVSSPEQRPRWDAAVRRRRGAAVRSPPSRLHPGKVSRSPTGLDSPAQVTPSFPAVEGHSRSGYFQTPFGD